MRRQIGTSLYAGVLFSVLGTIAWVSGQPFIFPSLGPSAFILAYLLFADGVVLTATSAPLSVDGLRLAASGSSRSCSRVSG